MICPVVVVVNKLKPFTHALPRLSWDYYQSSSKWLFCFLRASSCTLHLLGDATRNRTPHVSKHPSRGGAEGKRTRYVERLGGSSRIIRATGRIFKSRGAALAGMKMPTRAVRTFPSYSFNGVGGSLGENPHR